MEQRVLASQRKLSRAVVRLEKAILRLEARQGDLLWASRAVLFLAALHQTLSMEYVLIRAWVLIAAVSSLCLLHR